MYTADFIIQANFGGYVGDATKGNLESKKTKHAKLKTRKNVSKSTGDLL